MFCQLCTRSWACLSSSRSPAGRLSFWSPLGSSASRHASADLLSLINFTFRHACKMLMCHSDSMGHHMLVGSWWSMIGSAVRSVWHFHLAQFDKELPACRTSCENRTSAPHPHPPPPPPHVPVMLLTTGEAPPSWIEHIPLHPYPLRFNSMDVVGVEIRVQSDRYVHYSTSASASIEASPEAVHKSSRCHLNLFVAPSQSFSAFLLYTLLVSSPDMSPARAHSLLPLEAIGNLLLDLLLHLPR